MKRLMGILVASFVTVVRMSAVTSPAQVVYDHYFDAATFVLQAEASGDTVAYHWVMTYDEGQIRVPQGCALVMRLRDRTAVTLHTDREVGRADVMLRRWRDRTNHYITCYYPVTRDQLARLLDQDVYRLEIGTARGTIVRSVRGLKPKVIRAFSAVDTN